MDWHTGPQIHGHLILYADLVFKVFDFLASWIQFLNTLLFAWNAITLVIMLCLWLETERYLVPSASMVFLLISATTISLNSYKNFWWFSELDFLFFRSWKLMNSHYFIRIWCVVEAIRLQICRYEHPHILGQWNMYHWWVFKLHSSFRYAATLLSCLPCVFAKAVPANY